jgi:hypothetical protein
MSGRLTALFGVLGATALGVWLKSRQRRSATIPEESVPLSIAESAQGMLMIDIDDDTAAEIIKRNRPALERALAAAGSDPQQQ